MKTLIIILSVLAAANGQACDGVIKKECSDQMLQMKQCIVSEVKTQMKHNFEQLKQYGQEVKKCYDQDGVKGVCTLPHRPSGPPPTRPPPGQYSACLNGTKNAFVSCFKNALGIPEDCLQELAKNSSLNGSDNAAFMHHNFFGMTPAKINASLLESCNGNQEAADKVYSCAKAAAKPYMTAIASTMFPIVLVCQAKNVCSELNPLPADCKAQAKKGREAFCQCLPKAQEYVKTQDACANLREAFANHTNAAHGEATDASAAHQDHPEHPDHPFDPCKGNICKMIREKMRKMQAEHGGQ